MIENIQKGTALPVPCRNRLGKHVFHCFPSFLLSRVFQDSFDVGSMLGSFLHRFGIALGSFSDSLGIVLKLPWNYFGIMLGSFSDVLGITWVSFGDTYGAKMMAGLGGGGSNTPDPPPLAANIIASA